MRAPLSLVRRAAACCTALALLALLEGDPLALAAPLPDDALVDQAQARLSAGDAEGALARLREAERLAPQDPRTRYLRGSALGKKGDNAGAAAAYREALALDPKLAAVQAELGAVLGDLGRREEALTALRAAVAIDPSLAEAWWNIGKKAPDREALAAFARAERLLDDNEELQIDYSAGLRKAGRPEEAVQHARLAVTLAPRSAAAQRYLGYALEATGKTDEAVQAFTASTRLDSSDANAWWALGAAERKRKRLDPARRALERARQLAPAAAPILAELAGTLVDEGQAARAEELLRPAIAKSPRSLALRIGLVEALAGVHRCPEARAELAYLPSEVEATRRAKAELSARCP